jgi:hypothetical protein
MNISEYEEINVPVASRAIIGLKKTQSKSLSTPQSRCLTDPNYKKFTCLDDCYALALKKKCGCSTKGLPECKTAEQIACDFGFYVVYYSEEYAQDECKLNCVDECERTYYELSTSYVSYPSENYLEDLMNNRDILFGKLNRSVSLEQLRKSLVSVNVFWKNLEYTLIEEKETLTLLGLISNIGGLLGKFVFFDADVKKYNVKNVFNIHFEEIIFS